MSTSHHGVRVLEDISGVRPLPTIETAVGGIVVIAPDAQGVLTASASIGVEADNTGLTLTAKTAGAPGNLGAITLEDPIAAESPLAVTVDGKLVTVSLETDVDGDLVSTAAEVLAAVNAVAAAPFTLAHTGDSDGSGVMSIVRRTYLAGGEDEPFPLKKAVLLAGDKSKFNKLDPAGENGGSMADAKYVFSQGYPYLIVVRVAEGVDQGATDANVIEGLEILKAAKAQVGEEPRNLGAPGLDTFPVAKALESMLDDHRAFAYVLARGPDGTSIAATKEEAVDYYNRFAARDMMVLWPRITVFDRDEATDIPISPVGVAVGLRAKIDDEVGWNKTISNVPVELMTGTEVPVSWSLTNPNTAAGYLNRNGVTTFAPNNGWRFWGSRTCSDDTRYRFESASRTYAVLADTIAYGHAWAVDARMGPSLLKDIVGSCNNKFATLTTDNLIVGATAWLDKDKNPTSELALGHGRVDFDFSPTPPLEQLDFVAHITDSYLVRLVA